MLGSGADRDFDAHRPVVRQGAAGWCRGDGAPPVDWRACLPIEPVTCGPSGIFALRAKTGRPCLIPVAGGDRREPFQDRNLLPDPPLIA